MHIIVFTGGEYPKPEKTALYFSCKEKPSKVIAADSGLIVAEKYIQKYARTYSFYPDYILGDMDSIGNKRILEKYPSENIHIYNPDKDFSDTELALKEALKPKLLGIKSFITLVGGDGGRIDHFIGILDLFSTEIHPDVWLCKNQAVYYAPKGFSFTIQNLQKHDTISIARTTASRIGGVIKSDGLEWDYKLFRTSGMPSLSNRISDKNFHEKKSVFITIEDGVFLLILPLTASCQMQEMSMHV